MEKRAKPFWEEEEGIYTWQVQCDNCFHEFKVKIPKETSVKDYVQKRLACPNCGVKFLPKY